MKSIKWAVLGLGVILAAAVAGAQTNAAPTNAAPTGVAAAGVFKSADTNSDGRVSQDEYARSAKAVAFDRLDRNMDGLITLDEWKAEDHSPKAAAHFAALDKDRNGRVSYLEFSNQVKWQSVLKDSFKSLDRDSDGNLTSDELTKHPVVPLISIGF